MDAAVGRLRAAIRDRTGAATTYGYSPRFLHSTGQLHKAGPATGILLPDHARLLAARVVARSDDPVRMIDDLGARLR